MKLTVFSLLVLLSFHQVEPFINGAISTIYNLYQVVNDAHDTYIKITTPSTEDLMTEILDIKDNVNRVTKDVSQKIEELYIQLITKLPKIGQINRGMEAFGRHFNRISYLYKNFERLVRDKDAKTRTLSQFANVALNYFSDSVSATLDALHELFIPSEIGHLNDGLLMLLAQNLEVVAEHGCGGGAPPDEQLYLLYTALVTAELRGFMMQAFTYLLLENLSGESYAKEVKDSRHLALVRINEYMQQGASVVTWSSRVLFLCDPPEGYVRDVSFVEFEKLLSPYIAYQYSVTDNCFGFCHDFKEVFEPYTIEECGYGDDICRLVARCTGRFFGCDALGQSNNELCYNPDLNIASRRYQWLGQGNRHYGNKEQCIPGKRVKFSSKQEWHYQDNKKHRCDYCLCTCVEDTDSSKRRSAISLRPQLSDIANNKVVAGIRFVKIAQLLHLQIQQGEVQIDSIGENTLEWVPLESMTMTKHKPAGKYPTPYFAGDNDTEYAPNVDYVFLSYENRKINFDDLVAPDGYVVTGARLNRADDGAVQLEIHATPFDFVSTKVIISDDQPSIWIKPSDMKDVIPQYSDERSLIPETPSTIAVNFTRRTVKVSKPNTQIEFKLSNLEGDFQGTVYPLVDIRTVSAANPFVLEGIGLVYKRPLNDAEIGYVTFSLRGISRKKFLENEVTFDSENVNGSAQN